MKRYFHRCLFYLFSLTWGLPLTLCGALTIGYLAMRGHQIRRFGPLFYVAIGEKWGGLELGMFFLRDASSSPHVSLHEAGHALQNILYGPLMPFLITIPSAIRYHWRNHRTRRGMPLHRSYEAIWFEKQATALGYRYFSQQISHGNNFPPPPSK